MSCLKVDEYEAIAQERLAPMAYDYYVSGARDELTPGAQPKRAGGSSAGSDRPSFPRHLGLKAVRGERRHWHPRHVPWASAVRSGADPLQTRTPAGGASRLRRAAGRGRAPAPPCPPPTRHGGPSAASPAQRVTSRAPRPERSPRDRGAATAAGSRDPRRDHRSLCPRGRSG